VLFLWVVLAVLSVGSLAVPALASAGDVAPPVEVLRQEWGLPLTIVELAVLVAVIVPLVIGVTEFVKQFGVTGKWSRLFAMVLGVAIGGLVVAAALDVLPGWAGIAIVILLGGLLAGLAANGLYDLQNKNVKANRELVAGIKTMVEANMLGCRDNVKPQESRYDNLPDPAYDRQDGSLGAQPHPRVYDGPPPRDEVGTIYPPDNVVDPPPRAKSMFGGPDNEVTREAPTQPQPPGEYRRVRRG